MKYKLINKTTGEETPCDKVTIDGYDYYVNDQQPYPNDNVYSNVTNTIVNFTDPRHFSEGTYRKVIATNNPNIIDIPQVVDEVEMLANIEYPFAFGGIGNIENTSKNHFIKGYNKSQETHPFSEDDMIEFYEWCDSSEEAAIFWRRNRVNLDMNGSHNKIIREKRKELLQIWKEQKPKTIWYE